MDHLSFKCQVDEFKIQRTEYQPQSRKSENIPINTQELKVKDNRYFN